jgi:hypothetical protein
MALLTHAAVATAAGYASTKMMEQFNQRAFMLESEQDRAREQRVRPGPPPMLAAANLSERVLGLKLNEQQKQKGGMAFHYLAGVSWAPVYQLLRRQRGWSPVTAGLATGASMSLLLDEVITPAIGASAPNSEYPLSTHVRAFVAHLMFGLSLAALIEAGWKLLNRR